MTRITIAALLLALTGCVEAMPEGDYDNRLLNQEAQNPPQQYWVPRLLFE